MLSSPSFFKCTFWNYCNWSAIPLYSNNADISAVFIILLCAIKLREELNCFPTFDGHSLNLWCHFRQSISWFYDWKSISETCSCCIPPVIPDFRSWISSCDFIRFETWVNINLFFPPCWIYTVFLSNHRWMIKEKLSINPRTLD